MIYYYINYEFIQVEHDQKNTVSLTVCMYNLKNKLKLIYNNFMRYRYGKKKVI